MRFSIWQSQARLTGERMTEVRFTVDVVVIREGTREVLVVRRKWEPFENRFALPGGYIDGNETSDIAAARELEEETGIAVDADELEFVEIFAEPNRDPRGRYVSTAYKITVPAGTWVSQQTSETTGAQWITYDDILNGKISLAFDHADIIKKAVS